MIVLTILEHLMISHAVLSETLFYDIRLYLHICKQTDTHIPWVESIYCKLRFEHTHVYIYIYISMYVCMNVCMSVCMHVCMYMYVYIHIYLYIHLYAHAYVQLYIWMYALCVAYKTLQ